jgi:hypothetical protein
MAPKRKNKGAAGSSRAAAALDGLAPEESRRVLRRLLEVHPELGPEAEKLAMSILSQVDADVIAREVELAITALGVEALGRRAGRHGFDRYVHPTEAAHRLLDEAVEPFLADMQRCLETGLEAEALEVCKGVLLGLYCVREIKNDGCLGWAPDFPIEAAMNALEAWKKGAPAKARFPMDFVDDQLTEWSSRISRVLTS